jgi:hypothetical protein
MRILTLAITGVLAVAVSVPASAAKKNSTPVPTVASFEQCEQRALDMGLLHGQTGHTEYVRECMGKKPRGREPGND